MDRARSLRKIPTRLHSTNFCTTSARFAPSFVGNQTVTNTSKFYETHKTMSLESNGEDRVRSLQKIPTRLCGTNLCTSLARFELSVVTQQTVPNAPKWYETQRNMRLGSNGVDGVVCCEKFRRDFVARTFALLRPVLAPSIVRQPNGPECTQIV